VTDKLKTGRPSDFTQEIADEICTRLANGESLRSICSADRDDFIPAMGTVFRWLTERPIFQEQYAKAREVQAETMADEIVSIADGKELGDEMKVALSARDRLRVDSRKWVASKLLPKKYGDKIAHVGGGPDDSPIKTETILGVDPSQFSAAFLQELAAKKVE